MHGAFPTDHLPLTTYHVERTRSCHFADSAGRGMVRNNSFFRLCGQTLKNELREGGREGVSELRGEGGREFFSK